MAKKGGGRKSVKPQKKGRSSTKDSKTKKQLRKVYGK